MKPKKFDPNNKEKNFETFRRIRTKSGSLTVCAKVWPNKGEIEIGLAFCSPNEPNKKKFVKKRGRNIAKNRLAGCPITLKYAHGISIIGNVLEYLWDILNKDVSPPYGIHHMPRWFESFYYEALDEWERKRM